MARAPGNRSWQVGLVIAAITLAGLATGSEAAAAPACGERLIADWSDGRIDDVYRLSCYDEAVAHLPEDVRAYSSAEDDIRRALQERLHAESSGKATSELRAVDGLATEASDVSGPASSFPLVLLGASGAVALAASSLLIVRRRRRRT